MSGEPRTPTPEPRNWWRWTIPFAVVPVLVLLAYGFRTDPRAIPSPLIGKPAPQFTLERFDGGKITLDSLKGQIVVLNFWASWCYPACYEEAPVLEGGWKEYKDRGVMVIGVDIQDTQEAAAKFINQFSLTFPNGPDPAGKIAVDYGVYGVPETFFIDKRSMMRKKHVGAVTEAVFRNEVEKLLKEDS